MNADNRVPASPEFGETKRSGGHAARLLRRAFQAVLLSLPFVAAANYSRLPAWAFFQKATLPVFCGLISAMALYTALFAVAFRPSSTTAPPARLGRLPAWLLAGTIAAVFCLNAGRGLEFFPALIDSEADDAIRLAEAALDRMQSGSFGEFLSHQLRSYNLGLMPLVTPVVAFMGPSRIAYKWANAAFFAAMLAALAVLFARTTAPPGTRWTVLLLPLVGAILPSLQMHRWHAVCLAGCLALLCAASAAHRSRREFYVPLGLFLLTFALYHGQIIYLPALLALAAWHMLAPGGETVPRGRVAAFAVGAVLTGAAYEVLTRAGVLAFRLRESAASEARTLDFFTQDENLGPFFSAVLDMPVQAFSWPAWGLVLLGTAVTFERARRHMVDRAALLLFGAGFSLNLALHTLMNPSRHCWFLLPGLWLLLNGAAGLAARLREVFSRRVGTVLALLALGFAGWNEAGAYFEKEMYYWSDSGPLPWNTRHQLDYIFRHFSRLPPDASTLHLVPGPKIEETEGGFARAVEGFLPLDWRDRKVMVREFGDERELRLLIQGVREGRVRFSRANIYLSQIGEKGEPRPEKLLPTLGSVPCEVSLLELQGTPLPAPMRCLVVVIRREAGQP